jgi:hypothetical protein
MKIFMTNISFLAAITVLAFPSYGSRTEPFKAKETQIQQKTGSTPLKKRKNCVQRLFTCLHNTKDQTDSTPDNSITPAANKNSTAASTDGADTSLSTTTNTSRDKALAIGPNNTKSEKSDNSLLPDLSKGTTGSASINLVTTAWPVPADEERHINSPRTHATASKADETHLDK